MPEQGWLKEDVFWDKPGNSTDRTCLRLSGTGLRSVPTVIFLYSRKARKNFVFNAVYSSLLKSRKFRKIPPWLEKGVSLWARNWKKAKLDVAGDTQHFRRLFSHPFVMGLLFFPVVLGQ